MFRYCLAVTLFSMLVLGHSGTATANDEVFSGPQVGEILPPLPAKGVFEDLAGQEFDLIKQADGKPVALIFFHQRTRPAFGLTNTIMQYAASRAKDGLQSGVIFLTDDPTATTRWMGIVQQRFPKGVAYGISGIEGPGSYGLNRNVTLTVLVGNEGKVTANFALVQPSLQADGPKILKAIVDATGGGKVPTIAELGGGQYAAGRMTMRSRDPKLTSLMRAVINKNGTPEQIEKAAAEVEKYVAENPTARRQLGQIASTVAGSDRISNYGTEVSQKIIRKWAKEYGGAGRQRGGADNK